MFANSLQNVLSQITLQGQPALDKGISPATIKATVSYFATQQILNIQPSLTVTQEKSLTTRIDNPDTPASSLQQALSVQLQRPPMTPLDQISRVAISPGADKLHLFIADQTSRHLVSAESTKNLVNAFSASLFKTINISAKAIPATWHPDANQARAGILRIDDKVSFPSQMTYAPKNNSEVSVSWSPQQSAIEVSYLDRNSVQRKETLPLNLTQQKQLMGHLIQHQPIQIAMNHKPLEPKIAQWAVQNNLPINSAVQTNKNTGYVSYPLPLMLKTSPTQSGQAAVEVHSTSKPVETLNIPKALQLPIKQWFYQQQQGSTAIESTLGELQQSRTSLSQGSTAQAITQLIRQALPIKLAPDTSLQNIIRFNNENALEEMPEIKQWLQSRIQQVTTSIPANNTALVPMLQQLFSAPSLPTTATQLISPAPNQGFVAGIVALLQLSLSARLVRQQPEQTSHVSDFLSTLTSGKNASSSNSISGRQLQDFSNLENRHQLTRQLAGILANHTANKASNADTNQTALNTFYYSFAIGADNEFKTAELLIKHEQKNKKQQLAAQQKVWHLTLKLPIEENNFVLAKARIDGVEVSLNLYATDISTRDKVLHHLPQLQQRLVTMGFKIEHAGCQLGKIPDSIQPSQKGSFEIRV